MNRRPLWIIVIGAVVLGVVLVALSGVLSATNGPASSTAPSGSRAPVTTASAPSAIASSSQLASPSPIASVGAAATCLETDQIVIVRALDPATNFPVKVAWTNLGPADDLFLTLSDVSPTIPITPAGPVAITIGLAYLTGGDRFALTAGAVALVYDPGTGKITGDLGTGYGKNSNRATTDAQPSQFEGTLTPPTGGANGSLVGTIRHAGRRDHEFRVEMTQKTVKIASGAGCPSARPSDTP
jgi:hypothetical protein